MRIVTWVTATVAAGTAVAALATAASAGTGPGTPAQIATDVAASLSISSIPSNLTPTIQNAGKDTAYVGTPTLSKCNGNGTKLKPATCLFGDPKGTHSMVLWGDSHAFMWFPAVNAVAKAAHWRLYAFLEYGCPVAHVSVWNPITHTPYTTCDAFRSNMITQIDKMNPSLVVMAEAFTSEAANAGGAGNTISTAQWQAGLVRTFKALHSTKMKRVILGSTLSSGINPVLCAIANPSDVQKCSVKDTAAQQTQRAAESAAAKLVAHTTFVDTLPWLCSAKVVPTACSQFIGDATSGYKVVYYVSGHMTETYTLFLTTVLRNALKPFMK